MKKRALWGLLALMILLAGCAAAGQENSVPAVAFGESSLLVSEESSFFEEDSFFVWEESFAIPEISLPEGFDSVEEQPTRLWEALATMFPVPEWESKIISFASFVEKYVGETLANRMAEIEDNPA